MKNRQTITEEKTRCSICGTIAETSGVLVTNGRVKSFALCTICPGFSTLAELFAAIDSKANEA
jgi:hypothetical protein